MESKSRQLHFQKWDQNFESFQFHLQKTGLSPHYLHKQEKYQRHLLLRGMFLFENHQSSEYNALTKEWSSFVLETFTSLSSVIRFYENALDFQYHKYKILKPQLTKTSLLTETGWL